MYHSYFVYIVSSNTGTIYVGMTNNLERRIMGHKSGTIEGFSQKYKCYKLVYFEQTSDVYSAIEREKQIKGLLRTKKEILIRDMNPEWKDLSEGWFE